MKNVKKLILGLAVVLGGTAFGQTKVEAYGTYFPSKGITVASKDKQTITETTSGQVKIDLTGVLGSTTGNTVPDSDSFMVSGGPLFYSSGPGGATMTCGHAGICAEMSNTTYIQWVDEW